jgi:hypothetical protein
MPSNGEVIGFCPLLWAITAPRHAAKTKHRRMHRPQGIAGASMIYVNAGAVEVEYRNDRRPTDGDRQV